MEVSDLPRAVAVTVPDSQGGLSFFEAKATVEVSCLCNGTVWDLLLSW